MTGFLQARGNRTYVIEISDSNVECGTDYPGRELRLARNLQRTFHLLLSASYFVFSVTRLSTRWRNIY